jgi:hypothetical protein
MADYNTESNNGLYFIVGGLVVVAALFGFMFLANDGDLSDITPSAGYETPENTTINNYEAEPATPDRTSTELRIDENGVSSTRNETTGD